MFCLAAWRAQLETTGWSSTRVAVAGDDGGGWASVHAPALGSAAREGQPQQVEIASAEVAETAATPTAEDLMEIAIFMAAGN